MQGGRRRQLRHGAGGDARHRRRERLRQERHRAVDPADRRPPGADRRGRDPLPATSARTARADRSSTSRSSTPNGAEMRAIRGAEIALIFQEPMSSFSPVHSVGNQIIEAILLHQPVSRREARAHDHRDPATRRRVLARAARRPALQPAERRAAPARDDRDGAVVQAHAA